MSEGQRNYADMSDSEKKKEDWMNSKWRPAMGWLYMLVCFCDFVLFPVLHAMYIAFLYKGSVPPGVPAQWAPLTLQGAGLFHLAMGAVLGLAAWGRTQEKMNGANNGGLSIPSLPTGGSPAPSLPSTGSFGAPTQTSFGMPSSAGSFGGGGFGGAPSPAPSPSFGGGFSSSQSIATTASGKKIVPQEPDPVI